MVVPQVHISPRPKAVYLLEDSKRRQIAGSPRWMLDSTGCKVRACERSPVGRREGKLKKLCPQIASGGRVTYPLMMWRC